MRAATSSSASRGPSMLRTIWRDNERYLAAYWEKFHNRYYVAGDSAHRDKDGYFWIMGRIDDVLNVAGHRLGTMEIESALVAHPRVAEAAVVGKPHDIKGESVFAFVVCRGAAARPATRRRSSRSCATGSREQVGAIAKPDDIRFADNLPKTRSGQDHAAPAASRSRAARRSRRTSRRWRIPGSSISCAGWIARRPLRLLAPLARRRAWGPACMRGQVNPQPRARGPRRKRLPLKRLP